MVPIIGMRINECNLLLSFGNSNSSYANEILTVIIWSCETRIRVSETWTQITLVNYASQLLEPNWNP